MFNYYISLLKCRYISFPSIFRVSTYNGPDGLRSHDLRFRRPPRYPDYATGPSKVR